MYEQYGKRTLDIIITVIALVVFAIPMLLVALWVKLDMPGGVLFRQPRYGKDRQVFTVYKFRTMSLQAPSDAPTNSLKDAGAYITRSGKIMRKLSLDELPQLFNVLRGEMSAVGPRPVVLTETRLIDLREEVGANGIKPGITGWAQVNGRDELNDIIKARMDGEYVQRFGLMMDIKCLLLTVFAVLSIKGHQEGHEQADSDDLADVNLAIDEG